MRRRRFTGEEEAELRRLHALGMPWSAIGRAIGRDTSTTHKKGQAMGLASHRGRGRPRGAAKGPRDPGMLGRAVELRRAGMTLTRIGTELGCSKQAAQRLLARWG